MCTLLLVGVAHAFHGMVTYVQQTVSSVRCIAKHTLKEIEEVSEVSNSQPVPWWIYGYGHFSRWAIATIPLLC